MAQVPERGGPAGTRGIVVFLLLAAPLPLICCVSGFFAFLAMAPSEPCQPPDVAECGWEPMAVLPAALLAGAYALAAFVVVVLPRCATWARILALALVPLALAPLAWALFVYRPY